jgi:hypothetical protein
MNHKNRLFLSLKFCFVLSTSAGLLNCGLNSRTASETSQLSALTDAREAFSNGQKYELITPTGESIMAASAVWLREQARPVNADSYAQPAQCARNVSKVMALAGLGTYSSAGVDDLVSTLSDRGGLVIALPKSTDEIAQVITSRFGGKIPTGTLIAGCLRSDCSGEAGDAHVAIVGDIDSAGAVKAYHNNWYRPDNEGGVWKNHMIPLSWYQSGYLRKWMSTPWLNIYRQPVRTGVPYEVNVELPAIDDLDPTNYYVRLAVPVEIVREYKARQGKVLDAQGNQVAL